MSDLQQPLPHKIALGIEYDGSKYYGWQRQNEVRSVQEKLEKRFLRSRMSVSMSLCGAHGCRRSWHRRVVHFETHAVRKDATGRWA